MATPPRLLNSSLAAALSLFVFVEPSAADASFSCIFEMECAGADQPCTQIDPLIFNLAEQDTIWGLQAPDGEVTVFVPVETDSEDVFTLLAANSDPDATATSILSLFEGGQAILTTHGEFVTPGVVTQVGTCQAGEPQ